MLNKKYSSYRKTIQSTRSELDKLEKCYKSELRMISTTAFKFRSKFFKAEDTRRQSETEAVNVRMYETHFPGFCYEKDGKYRKKVVNNVQTKIADPVESSEKAKALLFTDNELDIRKVICLHLLETHLQSRKYIYRKDGKLCHFVKAPNYRGRHGSQQTTQKLNEKSSLNVYDKMLPRYVLDVLVTDNIISNLSLNSAEYDSPSEEGLITRRFQVPIYTNTDIRTITSSVLEALEAVESPKLKEILSICQDTDKLKHLLLQEEVLEFLIQLTGNQLISRSTAYEVTMTYPVFDKDSNSGETVAQILEFPSDIHVKNILHLIRRTISRKCDEFSFCSVPPRRNNISEGLKQNMSFNLSKTSFASSRSNTKNSNTGEKDEYSSTDKNLHMSLMNEATMSDKTFSQTMRTLLWLRQKSGLSRTAATAENFDREETSMSFISHPDTSKESKTKQFKNFPDHDSKYDLKNLSNSQRILLGLKVASMKCKPVNMHQFENKQKVDILSLISSIVHPPTLDSRDREISTEDNCYFKDKKGTKQSISRTGMEQVSGLVNLSRHVLSEFRHHIATTENKRRVKKFLNSQV